MQTSILDAVIKWLSTLNMMQTILLLKYCFSRPCMVSSQEKVNDVVGSNVIHDTLMTDKISSCPETLDRTSKAGKVITST